MWLSLGGSLLLSSSRQQGEAPIASYQYTLAPAASRSVFGRLVPWVGGIVLALALGFGGGTTQGLWSDTLVQVASLPLIGLAAARLLQSRRVPGSIIAILLTVAILALPLLQLIPLPPEWWTQLPGRGPIAATYQAVGMALPRLPVSLAPAATLRGAFSLLPAIAIFLAVLSLDQRARRSLVLLFLGFVLVDVIVGLLQIMRGPDSPLYFYEVTNRANAVGFFANRNHNAALLYCAIPLAVGWGLGLVADRVWQRRLGIFMVGLTVAAAVLGVAIAGSRAGIALALVAGLLCIPLAAMRGRGRRARVLIVLAGNVIALLLAFQFGFAILAGRIEHQDFFDDIRWPAAQMTVQAAEDYDPLGSGFGSFVPIFQTEEPRSFLGPLYVNHAHDDWLEVWLEGGIPALVLAGLFLLWFLARGVRTLRRRSLSPGTMVLARAAWVTILLLLLHSIVDYPLRTTALMTLFGLCAALLLPQREDRVATPAARTGAAAALF